MEILLILAPLALPLLILLHHNHAVQFRQLDLATLKAERRITDALIHKMQTGQFARVYTGPKGPQGPQGIQKCTN